MTVEQRISALEQELEGLRAKPVERRVTPYMRASQECDEHFEAVRGEGQRYGAHMVAREMARSAFKERHNQMRSVHPSRYIATEAAADEYVGLYKAFLAVYQNYLQGGNHYEAAKS
jgi:hypothetical protein